MTYNDRPTTMIYNDLQWPTMSYNDLLKWLTIKEKDERGSGWRVWWAESIHCALSRSTLSPLHDSPNDDSNYARGLEGRNKPKKTLAWFSFILKLKWKCTNIKALLGNDKILIRAGKNQGKIINKLLFPQCFLLFRVHKESVQLAQQRGFHWFKAQWNVFYLCTANMLQCPQRCKLSFILAHYKSLANFSS